MTLSAFAQRSDSRSLAQARRAALRAAQALERMARELWLAEARLSVRAGATGDSEAEALAGILGAVLVDRLHPATETLRAVGEGREAGRTVPEAGP